ncbi:MAG: DUF4157 domain-containing protein [Leptolyngbya sp. SIO1D8]|nr:DUF4157 domain-containing protein [Leptolyngbya sp. SIO1D8]
METLEELGVPSYVIAFFKAMAELPKKGIMALWDFLKTVFASLKGEFLTTLITDMIIPEVVIAGIQWLIGLLNPASGIIKIVKAIVDVIIFLFNNKEMIFEVLASVGQAFSALISKSWSPVAMAVEMALANIIPLALGLFVSLLGLGGIPKRIGKVMEKLRAPVDKGLTKVLDKMGMLLDPVGAVAGGVAGLKDKAQSKKNKKKGLDDDTSSKDSTSSSKDDDDKKSSTQTDKDDDDKTSDRKTTTTPSSKQNSKSIGDDSSVTKTGSTTGKSGTTAKADTKGTTSKTDKDKKKDDDADAKKKKDDDDDKRKTQEDEDDSKRRLSAGMREVDQLAEQKRDPSSVEKELSKVKKKHDLDSLKLKKSRFSKRKYTVTGEAKAETSSSKKSSKKTTVRRKPLSSGVPNLQLKKSSTKNDWNDKSNEVATKTKLKHKKKKGGDFTVDAELIEQDKVLKEVEKKLKRKIKLNARVKKVEPYLRTLKAQYKLKTLKLQKLEPDGDSYRITGELDKNKGSTAQRKAVSGAGNSLANGDAVEARIQRAAGKGQPIVPKVREPLEDAFGVDFSPVRIHADNEGHHLSNVLQAKAFTTGSDIFFRQGAYTPDTQSGKHLLAHELTHVVQQSGEKPDIIPRQVQREGSDPPPIQRSPLSSGLWIQREVEDEATAIADGADSMAGSVGDGESTADSGGMASMASGMGMVAGSMAGGVAKDVGMAVGREAISSALPPTAKIKSSITRDNTYMSMFVNVKERSLSRRKKSTLQDDMSEEEGLPDSLISDIVRVIQDIVNQNPDDDTVARKLDKVRVMFGMDVVKLVGYAEVGDDFEYIIKIKGQARFLRKSTVDDFIKRLVGGPKKAGTQSASKTKAKMPGKSATSTDMMTDATKPSAPVDNIDTRMTETAKPAEADKSIESTASSLSPDSTTDKQGDSADKSPGKAKPSSTKNKDKSKAKVERAQEREIKINAKVRRIDAHTVDVTIRATPQSNRKTD